jgi:hypothetical protein
LASGRLLRPSLAGLQGSFPHFDQALTGRAVQTNGGV